MSAFVNGALSALAAAIQVLDRIDPEKKSEAIQAIKTAYLMYAEMYKAMDMENAIPKSGAVEALKSMDEYKKQLENEMSGELTEEEKNRILDDINEIEDELSDTEEEDLESDQVYLA